MTHLKIDILVQINSQSQRYVWVGNTFQKYTYKNTPQPIFLLN